MKGEWTMLYKKEYFQNVWIYEPLQKGELKSRKKEGWRVWK